MFTPPGDFCLACMKGEAKKQCLQSSPCSVIIIDRSLVPSIHRILLPNVAKSNKTMSQKLVKRMISNVCKAGGLI